MDWLFTNSFHLKWNGLKHQKLHPSTSLTSFNLMRVDENERSAFFFRKQIEFIKMKKKSFFLPLKQNEHQIATKSLKEISSHYCFFIWNLFRLQLLRVQMFCSNGILWSFQMENKNNKINNQTVENSINHIKNQALKSNLQ